MGFKSATQNRQSQGYKVNALIFPSKETFNKVKNIDFIFYVIVENALSHYFVNIPKIKVIETYSDACQELDGLLPNATGCLKYEDEETSDFRKNLYKAAIKFFDRIEIVEY